MKFEDIGVIIDIKKHNESSAIIKIFSKNHGIYRGFVKSAFSKKNQSLYQVGNLISFEWRSRIEENLGNFFYCDIEKSYSSKIIFNKLRLGCFLSLIAIINSNFHERELHESLYLKLIYIIESFADGNLSDRRVIIDYVIFEFELLSELGYGLDLAKCAVSSSQDNLIYVSPKSGRAVSKEIGDPYGKKILALPSFIHCHANDLSDENGLDVEISDQDILNGFKLTGFFLEKHIFAVGGKRYDDQQRSLAARNVVNILERKD